MNRRGRVGKLGLLLQARPQGPSIQGLSRRNPTTVNMTTTVCMASV